jgi:hypothetical protein
MSFTSSAAGVERESSSSGVALPDLEVLYYYYYYYYYCCCCCCYCVGVWVCGCVGGLVGSTIVIIMITYSMLRKLRSDLEVVARVGRGDRSEG